MHPTFNPTLSSHVGWDVGWKCECWMSRIIYFCTLSSNILNTIHSSKIQNGGHTCTSNHFERATGFWWWKTPQRGNKTVGEKEKWSEIFWQYYKRIHWKFPRILWVPFGESVTCKPFSVFFNPFKVLICSDRFWIILFRVLSTGKTTEVV